MDFARMPVFGICLVLFGFVIVVPGSTLNAIDSATTTRDIKPSTPPAADSPPYLAPTTLTTTATPITIIATTTATARLAGTTIKAPTSTLTTITTRGPSLKLKSYSFTLNNDDDRDVDDDDDDDDDDHNGLNTEKTHNDEGDVGNVGIGEAHLEAQSIMSSLSLQGLELPVGGPGVPERTTKANKAGSVGGSERRANNGVAASKGNKGPDNTMPTGAAITTTSTTTAKIVKGTKEMVAGGVRTAAAIVEQVTMVLPAKLVATMIPPTGSSNNNNNNSNNNNPATVSSSSSRKKSNTIRSLNDKQVATIAKDDSQYEKDMTVVSSISRSPADNDDEEVEEYVAIAIDVGGGMAAFPAKLVQQPKILYNNNNAIVNNITSNNDKNNNHNNKYTAEQYKEEEAKDVDERGKEEVQQMLWRERQEYIRQVHAAIAAAATASSSAAAESSSPSSGSVSTGTATGRADDVTTIKQDLLAFAFNNNSLIATTTAATAPPSSQSSAVLAGAGENTTIPLSSSPGTFALLGPSAALTTADSSVWGGNQQAPTSTPAQSSSSSSLSPLLTAAVATTTATIRTQLSSTASVFSSSAAATTAAEVTATTPKTTASTTTKRRFPVRTTTMKPPPAIDDYQTITSQAGTHAYLPCNVKQLVKKPISWLRVRDGHILTVDQTTFIADQRFQSIYTTNPERWSLQIKYVQLKDAGTYECQVSTEPKASAIVNLRIVEPRTELIGEPTRHVKAGSQVKLHCIISQALEPPLYINWFYNQKQIYLHNHKGWRTEIERIDLPPAPPPTRPATRPPTTTTRRPAATQLSATTTAAAGAAATGTTASGGLGSGSGITAGAAMRRTSVVPSTSSVSSLSSSLSSMSEMLTNEVDLLAASGPGHAPGSATTAAQPAASANVVDVNQITTASLIIPAVQKLDSGNYTCSPSNSAPRTVVLHVLNGEYSASAITSGCASPAAYKISWEKPWQEWLGAIFVVFAIGFVKFILEHAVVNGDRLKLLNTLLWRDAEDTSRTSEHDKRTGGVWKTTTTRILNRIARGEYT